MQKRIIYLDAYGCLNRKGAAGWNNGKQCVNTIYALKLESSALMATD